MGSEEEYLNEEMSAAVSRYETMVRESGSSYFDVHEFEIIFDYYFSQRKYRQARQVLKMARSQHPAALSLELKEAQILVEKGKAREALEKIALVESIDRNNENLYLLKGSAFLLLDQMDKAQQYYEIAIGLTEDKEEWILNISYTFEKIGQYKRAIYLLEKYLEENDETEDILWELAIFYEQDGQDDNALIYYDRFLNLNPFSESCWYNKGVILNQLERFEDAIEAFDFVLAINPDYNSALFNKGNTYANMDMHEEAIKAYNEFLLSNENHPMTLNYIGESYDKLNDKNMAYQYFRKARAADPSYSEPWYGLAGIMLDKDNPYEALYYIKKALKLKENNPDYLFLLGKVNIKLEFFEEALKAFQDVLLIDPDDEEAKSMVDSLTSTKSE
jgi:tetratricopeptide (TPR) repeat protein